MLLSDFKIRQVVFEIRYDSAYILWDRAGFIADEVTKIWPGVALTEGTPNAQTLAGDNVTVATGLSSSNVSIRLPRSVVEFAEQIARTTEVWVSSLHLHELTRVGTRVMYARAYSSAEAAEKAVLGLGLVKVPEAPIFNHKGLPHQTDLRLHWQDEDFQTQLIIKPEHHELEVVAALPDASKEKNKQTADVMLLDIDRATRGTLELSKFRVSEWLEGVNHLIARDVGRILRET